MKIFNIRDDWKAVLTKAWSVRLSAISAALTGIIVAWPTAAVDIWNVMPDAAKAVLPPRVVLVVPAALTLFSIWARVTVQKSHDDGAAE